MFTFLAIMFEVAGLKYPVKLWELVPDEMYRFALIRRGVDASWTHKKFSLVRRNNANEVLVEVAARQKRLADDDNGVGLRPEATLLRQFIEQFVCYTPFEGAAEFDFDQFCPCYSWISDEEIWKISKVLRET